MGFLDFFSKRRKPADASAPKPSLPPAPEYPEPFPRKGRTVHPDWVGICEWAIENVPPDQLDRFFDALLVRWLSEMADLLDNQYTVYSTQRALFLTEDVGEDVEKIVRYADSLMERVPREFPGLRRGGIQGRGVFLQFEGRDLYLEYASHFLGPGTFGASGAMMVNKGYPHVVLKPMAFETIKATMAHEVLHVFTSGLPMPAWLNEGLAQRMESLSDEMVWREPAHRSKGDASRVWNEDSIKDFWSGNSFHMPGEIQLASYGLASELSDSLAMDGERFQEYITLADWRDGGEAAMLQCFGMGLSAAMNEILGPGNWGYLPKMQKVDLRVTPYEPPTS